MVEQATVLIISDDPELARLITSRWQSERQVPTFTLMGGDLCASLPCDSFDLAILGGLQSRPVDSVLAAVECTGKPFVVLAENTLGASALRAQSPRALVLQRSEGWLDACVLLGASTLRRVEALRRAEAAEHTAAAAEHHAALGRYILEVRHNLNNALTSVLGNSELLLLDADEMPAGRRTQLETIRNMAMRVHEILARFSSLDAELRFVDQHKQNEKGHAHVAMAD
jgi:signal transduction histidine kinase